MGLEDDVKMLERKLSETLKALEETAGKLRASEVHLDALTERYKETLRVLGLVDSSIRSWRSS